MVRDDVQLVRDDVQLVRDDIQLVRGYIIVNRYVHHIPVTFFYELFRIESSPSPSLVLAQLRVWPRETTPSLELSVLFSAVAPVHS